MNKIDIHWQNKYNYFYWLNVTHDFFCIARKINYFKIEKYKNIKWLSIVHYWFDCVSY